MRRRVFLYGFYGIQNAGNEAMLRAFTDPIRQHFGGDIEFVVASRHPSDDYDSRFGVRTVPNLEYAHREDSQGRWLRGLNPDDSSEYMDLIEEISRCDLVVLGPGQFLVETGERGMLKGALAQALAVVGAATLAHVPVYGLALACEDLVSPWSVLLIDRLLPAFSALNFRDPKSVQNLRRAGLEVPDHEVLGDLALLGEAAPAEDGQRLLDSEGVPPKRGPRLAAALRNIYWLGIDQDEYRDRIAAVLTEWVGHEGRDVVLVPQNVYTVDGNRDDDRAEAMLVKQRLDPSISDRVHLIEGQHDPRQTEAVYGLCDVTLSARLHGSVFSCKQGTPPVVFAFMDKTRGFFSRMGMERCMIGLDAPAAEISQALESALADRDAINRELKEAVAGVRSTASRYPAVAIELLEAKPSSKKLWASEVIRGAAAQD